MEWFRSLFNGSQAQPSQITAQPTPKSDLDRFKGSTELSEPLRKINAIDLANDNKEAKALFCELLKKRGYAVVTAPPEAIETAEALEKAALDYFTQAKATKDSNQVTSIVRENLGYVHIPGIREYIKLRPNDADALWPTYPEDFRDIYRKMYENYSQLAWNCFLTLATYVDASEGFEKPLMEQNTVDAVKDFVFTKSSVSMIHYFSQKEAQNDVCDTHKDTGILTFLLRTKVPSLEIWDKLDKKFIQAEKLTNVGDIFVYMGEKTPLFTGSKSFPATPHRVIMRGGVERLSMAFLLDTAK